ncbi:MAG TPA: hypothetical protein VIA63_08105 [Candidatus Limnocylindria bacterium]|jgi:hypothetical protein
MTTIVQYECRSVEHLRAGSRHGNGGLVIHHGSVGYCDGVGVDGAHRWVATGGVPIETLLRARNPIDAGTYRTEDGALIHVRPTTTGRLVVEVDGAPLARQDFRVGAKLSDDPDWPDPGARRTSLLHAD